MTRPRVVGRLIPVVVCLFAPAALAQATRPADPALTAALRAAWTAERLTPELLAPLAGKVPQLLAALSDPALWPPKTDRDVALWQLPGTDGQPRDAGLFLPKDYTPDKAWPLIIALHGTGQRAGDWLAATVRLVGGDRVDQFVIVAPQAPVGGAFASLDEEIGQPAAVLAALSPRVRIDFNRVYLCGYSRGGHASFVAASLYSDRFAAVLALAGTYLIRPFTDYQARLLLPNLAGLPVWVVYGAKDTGGPAEAAPTPPPGATGQQVIRGIAATNQMIAGILADLAPRTAGLASVKLVELPDAGHGDVVPAREVVDAWLAAVRPALRGGGTQPAVRRFRRPMESWVDGVRALRLDGLAFDPTANINITARAGEAPEQAVRRHFDQQFGSLSVRIARETNTVTLATRRVAEVEVWLRADELNLAKPVNLVLNGQVRHRGVLAADATTLVYWLRLTGDTARPGVVRVVLPVKTGAVKINPPEPPAPLFPSTQPVFAE